jgi:catechol 2,3-dioxygenase-like lactoylglutathione lyase family enzyme
VTAIAPTSLDHVALWVADRDAIADLVCDHLGMHVIERTERFTLVGADAREGKLTLFTAEGPRERGALSAIVLRVPSLEEALAALPPELASARGRHGVARRARGAAAGAGRRRAGGHRPRPRPPEGVGRGDHGGRPGRARLRARRRAPARARPLGRARGGRRARGRRPLLNHLAVLVDSAMEVADEARRRGAEVADVVDAPNTLAVFLWGPDRVKLEFVEHKPGFSLV